MNIVGRVLWGLVIILVGVILLAQNTGYLPWSLWYSALDYWPVLLIGLGLQIAFSKWHFPGISLAIIAALILAAMNPYSNFDGLRQWRYLPVPRGRMTRPIDTYQKQVEVPLGTVQSVKLNLTGGSMNIEVRGDPDLNQSQEPLTSSIDLSWDKIEPKVSWTQDNQNASIALDATAEKGVDAGRQDWRIILNPSVVTDLEVTGGVSELVVDGKSAVFNQIQISTGVSRASLNLGLTGRETRVVIKSGVANVEISVPHSAGISAKVTGAPMVTKTNFSAQGLVKNGDTWETPNFSSSSTRIILEVACGAGTINLQREEP